MHAVWVSDREVAGLDDLWLSVIAVADPKSAECIAQARRHGGHPFQTCGDGDAEYVLAQEVQSEMRSGFEGGSFVQRNHVICGRVLAAASRYYPASWNLKVTQGCKLPRIRVGGV